MSAHTAVFYTIRIQGHLDAAWLPELYSLEISAEQDGTTRLSGFLKDQAALLGCLHRLVNLGAKLLSVESSAAYTNKGQAKMGQQLTKTMAAEETKILAQIEKMRSGWNQKDGALFAEPFTADADYTVWNGLYSQGREDIAAGHQQIFDTFYADTTLHYGEKHIRFLRDDVALVRLEDSHLLRANGERVREDGVRPLFVFVKEDDQWQIAAFQNTPVIK